MANPFEDESGVYYALVNNEGQHSLWPAQTRVPAGWREAIGPTSREKCIEYIVSNWTDMRPYSLVQAMTETDRKA